MYTWALRKHYVEIDRPSWQRPITEEKIAEVAAFNARALRFLLTKTTDQYTMTALLPHLCYFRYNLGKTASNFFVHFIQYAGGGFF